MALSNWDTIAWDENGKPISGVLSCPDGCQVTIYKNWAYLSDPNAHRGRGEPFSDNVVLEFLSGHTRYRRIHLYGKRGRQNSLFLAAFYEAYEPDVCLALFGIGAYGFKGNKWVGIERATLASYFTWLRVAGKEGAFPLEIPAFADSIRYNQGDAYLSDAMGFPTPATSPGKAEEPILMQMLQKKGGQQV